MKIGRLGYRERRCVNLCNCVHKKAIASSSAVEPDTKLAQKLPLCSFNRGGECLGAILIFVTFLLEHQK